jgi:hypothetical protein
MSLGEFSEAGERIRCGWMQKDRFRRVAPNRNFDQKEIVAADENASANELLNC